ncbi:MAG: glycosyltransferase family 2 protein [Oscillospiraceae bacterium]|nr:glycosyltransferase family 2 protein [Oscillospiraceae bacterium]
MVSVIIPVYNGRNYLPDIVKCLQKQTCKDMEIIIVNDGSTDNSYELAVKLAETDDRIKVLTQPNRGPGAARNTGLQAATGEYITFVDADDRLPEDYIQALVTAIADSDCCICGLEITDNRDKNISVSACEGRYTTAQFMQLALKGDVSPVIAFSGPVNRLWRADVIKNNGVCFDTSYRYGEDTVFNLTVLHHCTQVTVTDKTSYIAVEYPSSLSRSFSPDRFNAYKAIREKLYSITAADDSVKINIAQYLTDNFLARAGEILALSVSKKEKTVLLKALASSGIVTGKEIITARGSSKPWKLLATAVNAHSGMLVYVWFVLLPKMKA